MLRLFGDGDVWYDDFLRVPVARREMCHPRQDQPNTILRPTDRIVNVTFGSRFGAYFDVKIFVTNASNCGSPRNGSRNGSTLMNTRL